MKVLAAMALVCLAVVGGLALATGGWVAGVAFLLFLVIVGMS